jgi:hypothetical protein
MCLVLVAVDFKGVALFRSPLCSSRSSCLHGSLLRARRSAAQSRLLQNVAEWSGLQRYRQYVIARQPVLMHSWERRFRMAASSVHNCPIGWRCLAHHRAGQHRKLAASPRGSSLLFLLPAAELGETLALVVLTSTARQQLLSPVANPG